MRASSFLPIVRADARILILGSLPGLASLKQQQYYANPQNAFWRILEAVCGIPASLPYTERCLYAMQAKLAIWDVCQSAQRHGSLDSAIEKKSVIANDINGLLAACPEIALIVFNGLAAASLFKKHIKLKHHIEAMHIQTITLPSTSPANAGISFHEKLAKWKILCAENAVCKVNMTE